MVSGEDTAERHPPTCIVAPAGQSRAPPAVAGRGPIQPRQVGHRDLACPVPHSFLEAGADVATERNRGVCGAEVSDIAFRRSS